MENEVINPEPDNALDPALKAAVEAIIYVAEEPVTLKQITAALPESGPQDVYLAVLTLQGEYQRQERGLEIREIAGGYKMFTKPEHHETIRKFVKSLTPPLKLSMAALETLATIAYRQPITVPEIQQIRGVNATGVLKTLLERKLITTAGRKNVIGRPILYKTTKEFLIKFGLSGLAELPTLEEFGELARAALGGETGKREQAADGPEAPVGVPEVISRLRNDELGTVPTAAESVEDQDASEAMPPARGESDGS